MCAMMIILEKTNENGVPGILRDLQAHDMTRTHIAGMMFVKDGTNIPISDGDILTRHGQLSGRSDEVTLAAESNSKAIWQPSLLHFANLATVPGSSP